MKFIVAALAVFFVLEVPASANHSLGVTWAGNPPITISVDATSMSSAYQQAAAFAAANWSTSSVIDMQPGTKGRKVVRVIASTLCAYACAVINTQNGFHVKSVTVHINVGAVGDSEFDQQGTLCHELGHAISLDHQPDITSCMYPTTAGSNVPNAHDYEQLELIYGR